MIKWVSKIILTTMLSQCAFASGDGEINEKTEENTSIKYCNTINTTHSLNETIFNIDEILGNLLSYLDFEAAKNIRLCNKNFLRLIPNKEGLYLFKRINYYDFPEDFKNLIDAFKSKSSLLPFGFEQLYHLVPLEN